MKKKKSNQNNTEIKKLDITSHLNHEFRNVDPEEGLTDEEVERSRQHYGTNKLEGKKPKSAFARFLISVFEPLNILLLISAIISLGIAIWESTQKNAETTELITMYVDVAVVLLIVFGNSTFSVIQEGKSLKNLEALKNMTTSMTKVLRNGDVTVVESSDIVVGDILVLEAGDKVVADALIIEEAMLEVDESVLTGESHPVEKDANAVVDIKGPIGDQRNKIFSGTSIVSGTVKAQVYAVGMNTQMGNIAHMLSNEKAQESPMQRQIRTFSKWLGIAVVGICLLAFFVYILVLSKGGFDAKQFWHNSLDNAIALAIAAIPEGLVALVTVLLSTAVKVMASHNAIFKKMQSIETLGSMSVICSDKTGTLTQNRMTVVQTWQADDELVLEKGDFASHIRLLSAASLCSNGEVNTTEDGKVEAVGDPTETAIIRALINLGTEKDDLEDHYDRIAEIPFDSDRKMMTVVLEPMDKNKPYPGRYLIVTKGAIDSVALVSGRTPLPILEDAMRISHAMSEKALRVLAVSLKWVDEIPVECTPENTEHDLEVIGLIGMIDPIRPEAKEAIAKCIGAHIRPVMITGDHPETAGAIATELGILDTNHKVITGRELDQIDDEELSQHIDEYRVYARVSPEDKIRIVKAWQANEQVVGMTGDGVNDAPSLKAADIGCAMGITGTDVAKDAADMILTDDNFATIVESVHQGRHTISNIQKVILLLLTTNLSCLLTIFLGMITFGINVLSSLQILWINVVAETIPGFALGVNRNREKMMTQTPKGKNFRIITKAMVYKILIFSAFITTVSLLSFYIGLGAGMAYYVPPHGSNVISISGLNGLGISSGPIFIRTIHQNAFNLSWLWHNISLLNSNKQFVFAPQIRGASSFVFLTIGMALSSNAINFRSNISIFRERISDQKWVLISFLASALSLVLGAYTPGMDEVFNMDPINAFHQCEWINFVPYAMVALLFGLHEAVKAVDKKFNWKV